MYISEDILGWLSTIVFVGLLILNFVHRRNFIEKWEEIFHYTGYSDDFQKYKNSNRNLSDYRACRKFVKGRQQFFYDKIVEKQEREKRIKEWQEANIQQELEELRKWKKEHGG